MESFQHAQTMAFAINEINKNPSLLPNITLGYHLYDNCVMLGMAFRAAISLVSGTEKSSSNLNCTGPPPVIGIVGDPSSTPSIAISSVLGLFRVPIVRWDTKSKNNHYINILEIYTVYIYTVVLYGSVVEHCVSSAKGCGFDSQGSHILMKMYNLNAIVSHFG